jgi:hypothetical protein
MLSASGSERATTVLSKTAWYSFQEQPGIRFKSSLVSGSLRSFRHDGWGRRATTPDVATARRRRAADCARREGLPTVDRPFAPYAPPLAYGTSGLHGRCDGPMRNAEGRPVGAPQSHLVAGRAPGGIRSRGETPRDGITSVLRPLGSRAPGTGPIVTSLARLAIRSPHLSPIVMSASGRLRGFCDNETWIDRRTHVIYGGAARRSYRPWAVGTSFGTLRISVARSHSFS